MHWLLAYTKPRQEALAEEHLRRQGFEVLCPQLRVQKLRRRKWTWVEEPLFPRYLFVGATDDKSWAPVRSAVGVASLVRFGGQVAEAPSTGGDPAERLDDQSPFRAATSNVLMRPCLTSGSSPGSGMVVPGAKRWGSDRNLSRVAASQWSERAERRGEWRA